MISMLTTVTIMHQTNTTKVCFRSNQYLVQSIERPRFQPLVKLKPWKLWWMRMSKNRSRQAEEKKFICSFEEGQWTDESSNERFKTLRETIMWSRKMLVSYITETEKRNQLSVLEVLILSPSRICSFNDIQKRLQETQTGFQRITFSSKLIF